MTNWEKRTEEAHQIMEKYGRDFADFSEQATFKELKIVHQWIADNANRKQRKTAGLPNED